MTLQETPISVIYNVSENVFRTSKIDDVKYKNINQLWIFLKKKYYETK